MGERIRTFAWENTSLGPLGSWPQSLKTAIGLMLNSQHPIWVGWGPEASFLYNDAYIEVLSLAKHPWALGKPAAVVWAEIWDFCGPLADKVFEKGEASFVNDVRLFMSRGDFLEETFYSFSYSPIRDEAGNVGGLFCPSTEVTSKVLHTRRLRTLSELASESLIQKSISTACKAAAAILGDAQDDIPFALLYLASSDGNSGILEQAIGVAELSEATCPRNVDLSTATSAGCLWPLARIVRTSQPEIISIKDFEGFPLGAANQRLSEAFALPIVSRLDARPLGVLVAGVNPTRRLDSDYRSFFELVAGHIATAIQNARAAEEDKKRADLLAELDRAKTAFFSNVSHELRTPLTLILGPLEDGMRESSHPPEWLALAHRNCLRLLKLVNTLLDFTRIEAGRMEAYFEPTDLVAYTEELASVFRSGIERAGLKFLVNCTPSSEATYVDREMWEKIVFNLLSNALKFTERGEIEVRLERTFDGKTVQLAVRDTGIGIPEQELSKVFERFRRLKSNWSRSHEGTGIGLALVQELVRAHGGEIGVKSKVGSGTTFTVVIPVGTEHLPQDRLGAPRVTGPRNQDAVPFLDEASRWLPTDDADSTKPSSLAAGVTASRNGGARPGDSRNRILLADDNGDMRGYVQRLLAAEGYDVIAVGDGEEALGVLRREIPALILSDVMMPKLDGFGLLRHVRSDASTASIPVILLSARAGEESRVDGVEAGADDYLIKPFSARELLARVRTHLELARVRREAQEKLAMAHAQLADKATHLEALVQQRTARLRESMGDLEAFSYSVAHDMRAPLRSLQGYSRILLSDYSERLDQEGQGFLKRIADSAGRMDKLIQDVLIYSRVVRNESPMERIDIGQLLRAIIETYPALSPEVARIDLEGEFPPVLGNEAMLTQIFSNLLGNAVKFVPPGVRPEIKVRAESAESGVRVSVKDNGIGIALDQQEKIFEIFQQVETGFEGTGIGLAIVKKAVDRMGGKVGVKSQLGLGSIFWVELKSFAEGKNER